jgi:very-short-patch-repair endonuclease
MSPQSLITQQAIGQIKLQRAKEMRRDMTPAERKLWARLRVNRLEGFHFRRQQIIEPYIVDFYCHQAALIIEVDGDSHLDQQDYDHQRGQNLQLLGLRVMRFSNSEVILNIDSVVEEILQACGNAQGIQTHDDFS